MKLTKKDLYSKINYSCKIRLSLWDEAYYRSAKQIFIKTQNLTNQNIFDPVLYQIHDEVLNKIYETVNHKRFV
jgi:hypothetical protein